MPFRRVNDEIRNIKVEDEEFWVYRFRVVNQCKAICDDFDSLSIEKRNSIKLTKVKEDIKEIDKGINSCLVLLFQLRS